jgi:hypothetical protein
MVWKDQNLFLVLNCEDPIIPIIFTSVLFRYVNLLDIYIYYSHVHLIQCIVAINITMMMHYKYCRIFTAGSQDSLQYHSISSQQTWYLISSILITYTWHFKCSDGKICINFTLYHFNRNVPITNRIFIWPVLFTFSLKIYKCFMYLILIFYILMTATIHWIKCTWL